MAKSKHEPVLFKNSLGETITNDPVYRAQQTLEKAGVDAKDVDTSELDSLRQQNEELQSRLAAAEAAATLEEAEAEDEVDETEGETDNFDEMDGAALKAYAKEHDIDISGLKKVSEVRDAIRASEAE